MPCRPHGPFNNAQVIVELHHLEVPTYNNGPFPNVNGKHRGFLAHSFMNSNKIPVKNKHDYYTSLLAIIGIVSVQLPWPWPFPCAPLPLVKLVARPGLPDRCHAMSHVAIFVTQTVRAIRWITAWELSSQILHES